jgi:hypothetical protein
VDFLLKPVLPEELKAEAERLLASRGAGPSPAAAARHDRETFSPVPS